VNMNISDANSLDMNQRIAAHRSGIINPAQSTGGKASAVTGAAKETGPAFSSILSSKIQSELRFSAHASNRLKSRNIDLTPEIMGKLEKAVTGAANKGARDSLILMKDLAFIVNVPNRTVITAMDGDSIKENVFTNIDSAVIAD
jgi:flagellar operon protein